MSYVFPLVSFGTSSDVARGNVGLPPPAAGSGCEKYLRTSGGVLQDSFGDFRDITYEESEGIREVIAAIDEKSRILFVSGRAGTGKSRLINYLGKRDPEVRQVVVAPTGIAALSLGAQTIHSLFRLPVGVIDPDMLPEDPGLRPLLRRMTRLVIDEISMVRADTLDAIDVRLRQANETDVPFGGVQVIMVGDFLQLPPVVADEDRNIMEWLGYETPFAFSARALKSSSIKVATLTKVWRQTDPEMVASLGAIREGRRIDSAVAWLNAKCAGPHRPGVMPLYLTATREAARKHNRSGLDELRRIHGFGAEALQVTLQAEAEGVFTRPATTRPAPRELTLLPGARVMAVRNDPAGRFVNGSLGEVCQVHGAEGDLDRAYAVVRFDGAERDVHVSAAEWEQTRKIWDNDKGCIVEQKVGRYRQLPLTPGYAITIHKSQGLTLEDVRLDIDQGTFAPGQLYVALSRARSTDGLSFTRPLRVSDARINEMLVWFLEWARRAGNIDFTSRRQKTRA